MVKNGIILAGGNGTRLAPLTDTVNKHLLSVNGQFILDYPINTLKHMGVENLTVILGGNHFSQVVDHLKDGSAFGMKCNYVYQGEARGIAQAINLCERYVFDQESFVVILGDNIFAQPIHWNDQHLHNAQIVLWNVPDLKRFGVASVDPQTDQIINIEEKPKQLDTRFDQYAITGCYLLDHRFFHFFDNAQPSARGEYEITDILNQYQDYDALYATFPDDHLNKRGEAFWSDAGTHESIARANQYFYGQKKS